MEEAGAIEAEELLHAQALEERAGVRLDGDDRRRPALVHHPGVAGLERSELDPLAGEAADELL